ncbi:hypothetical protein BLA29_006008 [Euroglyphus maynei]|uniref:Uncharacterized protein n=1 Tax=Euroglyphus maynei TaxID=6958 RepID=A0A1Y3B895_EURMA|nr:hypothetical protein BLA29_006008 [Euroglyphus maynei]
MLFINIIIISSVQIRSISAVGGRGVAISSKGNRGSIGAKPVDSDEDSGTLTVILVPTKTSNRVGDQSSMIPMRTLMLMNQQQYCYVPEPFNTDNQTSSPSSNRLNHPDQIMFRSACMNQSTAKNNPSSTSLESTMMMSSNTINNNQIKSKHLSLDSSHFKQSNYDDDCHHYSIAITDDEGSNIEDCSDMIEIDDDNHKSPNPMTTSFCQQYHRPAIKFWPTSSLHTQAKLFPTRKPSSVSMGNLKCLHTY